jgi:hypothetical protein
METVQKETVASAADMRATRAPDLEGLALEQLENLVNTPPRQKQA